MTGGVPTIFDAAQRHKNQTRIHKDAPLFVLDRLTDELIERILSVNRTFTNALIIAHTAIHAQITSALKDKIRTLHVTSAEDITPPARQNAHEENTPKDLLGLAADQYDLIAIIGTLHCVNDLPGWLHQIQHALTPDGLFMCGFPGGETLASARHALMQAEADMTGGAAQRIHPFVTLQDLAALLQRTGFALPVVDHDLLTIRYPTLGRALDDLRAMGEGNCLAERYPLRRSVLARLEDRLRAEETIADGKISFALDLLFATGWAPAPHQQKPLKPGSATHRLANALNSTEIALSDLDPDEGEKKR